MGVNQMNRPFSFVRMDDFGITYCEKCKAEILCNEFGDMPDTCPNCKRELDYALLMFPADLKVKRIKRKEETK